MTKDQFVLRSAEIRDEISELHKERSAMWDGFAAEHTEFQPGDRITGTWTDGRGQTIVKHAYVDKYHATVSGEIYYSLSRVLKDGRRGVNSEWFSNSAVITPYKKDK